jgi:hypothetical protein
MNGHSSSRVSDRCCNAFLIRQEEKEKKGFCDSLSSGGDESGDVHNGLGVADRSASACKRDENTLVTQHCVTVHRDAPDAIRLVQPPALPRPPCLAS